MDPTRISGRANRTAEIMSRIERVSHDNTTALAAINQRIQGRDISGLASQRQRSDRPAHGSPSSQTQMIRSPRRPSQVRMDEDLRRINTGSSNNRQANHVRTMDEINNGASGPVVPGSPAQARMSRDLWRMREDRPSIQQATHAHTVDEITTGASGAVVPGSLAQARMSRALRWINAGSPHNRQANHVHTVDEIINGASGVSNARTETFIQSLPVPSLTDLSGDSQDCPICFEQYQNPQNWENPVRLPCNHVLGQDCLQNWLTSSTSNINNNTCPFCRAVLFERDIVSLKDRIQVLSEELETNGRLLEYEVARRARMAYRIQRDAEHERTLERLRRLGLESQENFAELVALTDRRVRLDHRQRGNLG